MTHSLSLFSKQTITRMQVKNKYHVVKENSSLKTYLISSYMTVAILHLATSGGKCNEKRQMTKTENLARAVRVSVLSSTAKGRGFPETTYDFQFLNGIVSKVKKV